MRKCDCGGERVVKQRGRGANAAIYLKCRKCSHIEQMGTLNELAAGVLKIQTLIKDIDNILYTRTNEPGGMVNEWI